MEHKEEYERDYKHAMEHPHKGVRCQSCPATYFHPILGCPTCGKYKDIYSSEVKKEEDWEKEFDKKFTNKILIDWRRYDIKDFISSLLKENTQRVLDRETKYMPSAEYIQELRDKGSEFITPRETYLKGYWTAKQDTVDYLEKLSKGIIIKE